MVEDGSMWVMLSLAGLIEICSGAVLVEVSKGESDREAGDYGFDPLGFNKNNSDDMKLKELTNGRAAMMAFGGLATQTALGAVDFPYLVPYPNVAEFTW
jgi:hypothetical protein